MAAKMERTKEPGIYKRGSRYVVVWRHRGHQYKSFHRTLMEAREAKGDRLAGNRRPASKQPFEEYALAWLEGYQGRTGRGFGDGTRRDYRRALELYAIPFFGRTRLSEIEQPDVRRFVVQLQGKGLAPGSVRKYVAALKALLATAVEDGDLPHSPASGVRINTHRQGDGEREEQAKAMTRTELAAVLGALPEQWRLPFELLAHTGLRISELLGLDWADVAFGAKPTLKVRRQFYRGELKRHPKSDAGRRELPLSPGMARKLWAARPGFHTFRHTCASVLLDSGKNVRQLAAWLGHTDPSFTLRVYAHLMDQGLGGADFLDEIGSETPAGVGNKWATQDPETAANVPAAVTA